MALFRTGGGVQINIGAPDIVSQANLSSGATRTIAVTQNPKYVIYLIVRTSDTNGRHYFTFYDVENDCNTRVEYTASGYVYSTEQSGSGDISSVSSSAVVVVNSMSATCRTDVLIYY